VKLRRAAALALTGRYLMVPPLARAQPNPVGSAVRAAQRNYNATSMYQYGVCGIAPMDLPRHPEMQLIRVSVSTATFLDTRTNEIVEVDSGTGKEIPAMPETNRFSDAAYPLAHLHRAASLDRRVTAWILPAASLQSAP